MERDEGNETVPDLQRVVEILRDDRMRRDRDRLLAWIIRHRPDFGPLREEPPKEGTC